MYNSAGVLDMENYTFRLSPGQDLFDAIESFVLQNQIEAGCILSGVGSLTQAVLRLANREGYNDYVGYFEIVSVAGTVSMQYRMATVSPLVGIWSQVVRFIQPLRS
jgi:predicted DNA-binding protein with PD1-like motif